MLIATKYSYTAAYSCTFLTYIEIAIFQQDYFHISSELFSIDIT